MPEQRKAAPLHAFIPAYVNSASLPAEVVWKGWNSNQQAIATAFTKLSPETLEKAPHMVVYEHSEAIPEGDPRASFLIDSPVIQDRTSTVTNTADAGHSVNLNDSAIIAGDGGVGDPFILGDSAEATGNDGIAASNNNPSTSSSSGKRSQKPARKPSSAPSRKPKAKYGLFYDRAIVQLLLDHPHLSSRELVVETNKITGHVRKTGRYLLDRYRLIGNRPGTHTLKTMIRSSPRWALIGAGQTDYA